MSLYPSLTEGRTRTEYVGSAESSLLERTWLHVRGISRANTRHEIRNTRVRAARVYAASSREGRRDKRGTRVDHVTGGRPISCLALSCRQAHFQSVCTRKLRVPTGRQDRARLFRAGANYGRPFALRGNVESPPLTAGIGRATPRESQTVANAFICGVAILVIRRADVPSGA